MGKVEVGDKKVGNNWTMVRFLSPGVVIKDSSRGGSAIRGTCVENMVNFGFGSNSGVICGLRRQLKRGKDVGELIVGSPLV
jgi:hypothetical protein